MHNELKVIDMQTLESNTNTTEGSVDENSLKLPKPLKVILKDENLNPKA